MAVRSQGQPLPGPPPSKTCRPRTASGSPLDHEKIDPPSPPPNIHAPSSTSSSASSATAPASRPTPSCSPPTATPSASTPNPQRRRRSSPFVVSRPGVRGGPSRTPSAPHCRARTCSPRATHSRGPPWLDRLGRNPTRTLPVKRRCRPAGNGPCPGAASLAELVRATAVTSPARLA